MLSLTTPAALLLAATSLTLGAGAPVTPAPIAGHHHVAGVSDPDPSDCPFCGGNPAVHVKVLWQLQKYAEQSFVNRLL